MEELKVKKENALQAYNKASKETEEALRNMFGSETFEPFDFNALDENEKAVLAAYSRLRKKAKEKRGDWTPDYTNSSQRKWHVWFDYKVGVGFVVVGAISGFAVAVALVGSRLCFPTEQMALDFAKENIVDYRIILEK